MSDRKLKLAKGHRRPANVGRTYYGVRLAKLSVPSQFTEDQIEKAVKAAIAKNADVFTGRK